MGARHAVGDAGKRVKQTTNAACRMVLGDALHGKADLYSIGDYVAERARTRDLCIVPVTDPLDGQRSIAEAVVFGSGRPVLLFRPGVADLLSGGLSAVVLAWDGSRSAARAMADALPIMAKAREVRVLTVVNEKPDAREGVGVEAARHLGRQGIKAVVEEVDAAGRRIGEVFDAYAAECRSDLLVMGAYGRSRVREFILGGATEHMLREPKVPLLLSHCPGGRLGECRAGLLPACRQGAGWLSREAASSGVSGC